jgi:hypothetical protein
MKHCRRILIKITSFWWVVLIGGVTFFILMGK